MLKKHFRRLYFVHWYYQCQFKFLWALGGLLEGTQVIKHSEGTWTLRGQLGTWVLEGHSSNRTFKALRHSRIYDSQALGHLGRLGAWAIGNSKRSGTRGTLLSRLIFHPTFLNHFDWTVGWRFSVGTLLSNISHLTFMEY